VRKQEDLVDSGAALGTTTVSTVFTIFFLRFFTVCAVVTVSPDGVRSIVGATGVGSFPSRVPPVIRGEVRPG
jgi:hypothetical protein